MTENNKWYMAGTEKTGEYAVLVAGKNGRLGVRSLGNTFRVRFEPKKANIAGQSTALAESSFFWKDPDEMQNRFSTVVNKKNLPGALACALKLLKHKKQSVNPTIPKWLKPSFEKAKSLS